MSEMNSEESTEMETMERYLQDEEGNTISRADIIAVPVIVMSAKCGVAEVH